MEELTSPKGADLLDCYRIAVDFGLPAAENAISLLDESLQGSVALLVRKVPVSKEVPASD